MPDREQSPAATNGGREEAYAARTAARLARFGAQAMARAAAGRNGAGAGVEDPLGLDAAVTRYAISLAFDPWRVADVQFGLWRDYAALAANAWQRALGYEPAPVARPHHEDRRFRDPAWEDNAAFDLLKQAYLITTRAWTDLVERSHDLDERTRAKLDFVVRQVVDAIAPNNFAATNPRVLREILDTGGQNLLDGINNLLDDLEASGGAFRVSMARDDHFELGRDLATTPGKVVFQNELLQLIQYQPTTDVVARRPLLIIPPWMNKYYVLDLQPENSYVRWLVEQGQTVFVVSWVNPDASLADRGFEDYMRDGALAALGAVEAATGERETNVVGYCLGGILLAAAMAWLSARGEAGRVASATYLTTLVDFADTGEVSLFIDEETLGKLEAAIRKQGYLSGRQVADTFSVLRANDLVWSFFINSYLLGKGPRPFDILYWNADSTNMPAAMHTYFMRNMYLENRLREPGGVVLEGVPIDVRQVATPAYILSTVDDHIAPWRTTYETTQLLSGPVRFVLGRSGHIAGVVNPPAQHKYGYWTNPELPHGPDEWIRGAQEHPGSWWPDWLAWIQRHAGGEVPARQPGDGTLPVIEDAPGSYVRVRI